MNGYEFMAQNPVLTVILALIGGITATEIAKYLFGAIYKTEMWDKKSEDKEL